MNTADSTLLPPNLMKRCSELIQDFHTQSFRKRKL